MAQSSAECSVIGLKNAAYKVEFGSPPQVIASICSPNCHLRNVLAVHIHLEFGSKAATNMISPKHHPDQNHYSASLSEFKKTLFPAVKDSKTVSEIARRIQKWTSGEPFLTQLICDRVIEYSQNMGEDIEATIVDGIVDVKIIKNWAQNTAGTHLKKVCQPILAYEPRDSILISYIQILQRESVLAVHSPVQEVLLNSGLVTLSEGRLTVANAIYAKVFGLDWVETLLPGITRPVSIVSTQAGSKLSRSRRSAPQVGGVALGLALLTAAIAVTYFGLVRRSQADFNPAVTAQSSSNDSIASPDAGQKVTQLTLLGNTFSGYSTFRNANFQAALKEAGIDIKYDNEFDEALKAQKLNKGKADLIVTTLDQVLQQQPKGKIVGLLDRTVGADAVVLNTQRYPELKSLLDLSALVKKAKGEGKTLGISYAAGTPSEYLATVLDAQFDAFDLSDFELKPTDDASEAWALMQNPTADVAIAVLWEPYVTQAQQKGYKVVLSSGDVPNAIVDVIVASDKLIKSNPAAISRFLESYYRRIDANARDATQLQTQVAEDGNLSVSDAATIINGIDFFTAIETQNWMSTGLLAKRIDAVAAVLALANRLDAARLKEISADASSLYTPEFVTEAANNTQTIVDMMRADNPSLANKLSGASKAITVPQISPAQIQQAPDIGNLQVQGQVEFTVGAAELTAEGKQTLNQLASELNNFNGRNVAVRVIGHTSHTGDAASNQRLSEERANVVVNHLKGMGVALNILPEGKGFSEPLPNTDPTDPRNQRTEIRLVRVE